MSTNQTPKAALAQLGGSRNADELYDKQWVETGLTAGKEQLPSGNRGFNVSKQIRHKARRYANTQPEVVEEGDDYNKVSLGNPAEGWAKFIESEFGHRNAFAALSVWNGSTDELIKEFSEGVEKDSAKNETKGRLENAETVIGKVATKMEEKMEEKQVNSGVVQDATPIMIDPDFLNTVRSAAPILDWVDVVAQAGFTASYNIISGREDPAFGWSTESEVRDMSSNTGSAFTMPNEDKDMKIWADLLDISDFAARAQSSLDFMDLEGTSMQIRMQEYATEEAETLLYGEPTTSVTTGGPKDENAPSGLVDIANTANTSYTKDKSTVDTSGDKALFKDIKKEVLSLVNDTAASLGDLGIAVSYDMFHALENEANVNVRLREFDQGINFGRDPTGPTTLSIANVPVLPDPNIRAHNYGNGTFTGNVGDVFLFDRTNYQRRALQTLSSTSLGQLGLADRMALFQYETPVSRSQGEFVRVLENYSVDALA
jgi:hypothetical protein